MASTSIACDATGFNDEEQRTVWYRVTAFGRLADLLAKHQKGDLLSVSGQLSLSVWEKDGKEQQSQQVIVDAIVSAKTVRSGGKKRKADKPNHLADQAGYSRLYDDEPFNDEIKF